MQKALGSGSGQTEKMEGELETGEVLKHLQSTAGVPLSQERNLQLLRYGLVMSW